MGLWASLTGCAADTEPLGAAALRERYPDQADAILERGGSAAFIAIDGEFMAERAALPGADLEAAFPGRGDGALRFSWPGGGSARVRELGAAGEGAPAEGALAYAREGGVSFWAEIEGGYEEWLMLEPGAVRRDRPAATWEVEGAALRQAGEAVEVADARGAALRVTAPAAYAAGGRAIGARLLVEGQRVELWVEAEGEAVLVDPGWKRVKPPLDIPREHHTATQLLDGRVLLAGGYTCEGGGDCASTAAAALFDPSARTFTPIAPMRAPRGGHAATRLEDGRVLVTGGDGCESCASDATAELFDPATLTWTSVEAMEAGRAYHAATLLQDGGVLVTGGRADPFHPIAGAALFDPATLTWTSVEAMGWPRAYHTATLLEDGSVIVAGGFTELPDGSDDDTSATVERFDPGSRTWSDAAPMTTARFAHSATRLRDGSVLIAGGYTAEGDLPAAEVFAPATGAWTMVPPMGSVRWDHTAILLGDGRVLVAGGRSRHQVIASAELYDPVSRIWSATASMAAVRAGHTATPLEDGSVLVTGGDSNTPAPAELFDPTSPAWTSVAPLGAGRRRHTATLLEDHRVLIAGGNGDDAEDLVEEAELFDPGSTTWATSAPMRAGRVAHTSTRLPDGRVLVAGGASFGTVAGFFTKTTLATAELFDPVSLTWTEAPPMLVARSDHAAVLLADGRVLVAGGMVADYVGTTLEETAVASAELFDPVSLTWTEARSMLAARGKHTATLLDDGRVLVAGGYAGGALASVEVFDPAAGAWSAAASMSLAEPVLGLYEANTALRLGGGRVLVAAGAGGEIFDIDRGRWAVIAPGPIFALNQPVARLRRDLALFTGNGVVPSGLFDPATGAWTVARAMRGGHARGTATLLDDGRVLVAGGQGPGSSAVTGAAELFSLQPLGSGCGVAAECASGSCVDGVCCDSACGVGPCEACSAFRGAAVDGACTPLHPEYHPYACSPLTGEKLSPCRSVHDCVDGFVCDRAGACVAPPASGGYLDRGGCALAPPAPRSGARGALGIGVALTVLAALRRARRR